MANTKISDLSAASSVADADIIPIVAGGANYKASRAALFTGTVTVISNNAANNVLVLKGATSQTADLLQCQNDIGTASLRITPTGQLVVKSDTGSAASKVSIISDEDLVSVSGLQFDGTLRKMFFFYEGGRYGCFGLLKDSAPEADTVGFGLGAYKQIGWYENPGIGATDQFVAGMVGTFGAVQITDGNAYGNNYGTLVCGAPWTSAVGLKVIRRASQTGNLTEWLTEDANTVILAITPTGTISAGIPSSGAGNSVTLAGSAAVSGSTNGGDVILMPGAKSGSGADGQVLIRGSTLTTGLSVTSNAAGSGVTLAVLSSGTNEDLRIIPKGTGQIVAPNDVGFLTTISDATGSGSASSPIYGVPSGPGMYFASVNGLPNSTAFSRNGTNSEVGITSNAVEVLSTSLFGWAAVSNSVAGGLDTALARSAAAVVKVTDGSTGTGSLIATQLAAAAPASGAGNSLTLAGSAAASGNTNGGDVILMPGAKAGSGADGQVLIRGSTLTTGLSVTSNAAGSGVTLTVLSSGTDESLVLQPKGTGTVTVGNSSTPVTGIRILGSSGRDSTISVTSGQRITVAGLEATGRVYWANGLGALDGGSGNVTVTTVSNAHVSVTPNGTGRTRLTKSTSATNTVEVPTQLMHNTSGTPTAGFGCACLFSIDSSTTDDQDAGRVTAYWTDATHATRTSAVGIEVVSNAGALAEVLRVTGSGTVGTGLSVTGNAAGSGVTLTALSSGSDESLALLPKGTGGKVVVRQQGQSPGSMEIRFWHDGTDGYEEIGSGFLRFQGSSSTWVAINSGGEFRLASNVGLLWSNTSGNATASADTGLARSSAGVVKVTNGSTGTGSLIATQLAAAVPASGAGNSLTLSGSAAVSGNTDGGNILVQLTAKSGSGVDGKLVIKAATASPGSNLTEWKNSSDVTQSSISSDGRTLTFIDNGTIISTSGGLCLNDTIRVGQNSGEVIGIDAYTALTYTIQSKSNDTAVVALKLVGQPASPSAVTHISGGDIVLIGGAKTASSAGADGKVIVKAATSSPVGNLQEWQDSSSNVKSAVNKDGCHLFPVLIEANTAGSGAPNVLTAVESGTLLTNEGATAQNYHTLPSAAAGLVFEFIVQDADGIRVVANTGDTIRDVATVSATAGYIQSTTIGSTLRLIAINATEWIVTSKQGTWTIDS